MRIGFVMQGAERRHPLWGAVGDRLVAAGATVDFLWPDRRWTDLGGVEIAHDLYVLKCGAGLGLNLAGALHALGAATFNPYPVVALCRDKIMTSAVLAHAGVPVPDAWVAAEPDQLREVLASGPIVIKPFRGSRGMGVEVVHGDADLEQLELVDGPVFAQRYHRPDGLDQKIYVIGGEVRGVRRAWPATSLEDKLGQPFAPGGDVLAIARLCASALGIDTFGFDVVYSGGEPVVVDLSSLPGFKGVEDAEPLLAGVIEAAARAA